MSDDKRKVCVMCDAEAYVIVVLLRTHAKTFHSWDVLSKSVGARNSHTVFLKD